MMTMTRELKDQNSYLLIANFTHLCCHCGIIIEYSYGSILTL